MFLDLSNLSEEQLEDKLTKLYQRMDYMTKFGSHSNDAYAQCEQWVEQIMMEKQDRFFAEETKDWESGTVDIIGEESDEVEVLKKHRKEKERNRNNGKGKDGF